MGWDTNLKTQQFNNYLLIKLFSHIIDSKKYSDTSIKPRSYNPGDKV